MADETQIYLSRLLIRLRWRANREELGPMSDIKRTLILFFNECTSLRHLKQLSSVPSNAEHGFEASENTILPLFTEGEVMVVAISRAAKRRGKYHYYSPTPR